MVVKTADNGPVCAPQDLGDFADEEIAIVETAVVRILLVHANDDQVAVHRSLHGPPIDVDVRLFVAAEDCSVAIGMNLDASGMIGGEFQK